MQISTSVLLLVACEGGDPSHREAHGPNMDIVITENHGEPGFVTDERSAFGSSGCSSGSTIDTRLFRASLGEAQVRFAPMATLSGPALSFPVMHGDMTVLYVSDEDGYWQVRDGAKPEHVDTTTDSGVDHTIDAIGADLDGDGDEDVIDRVVIGAPFEHMVERIWERDGDKLHKRLEITPAIDSSRVAFTVADVDGDGFADIVSINERRTPVVYRGDGAFHFERREAGPAFDATRGLEARWVRVADADDDGRPDLIGLLNTTSYANDDGRHAFAALLPGDGHGSFGAAILTDMGSEGGGGADGGFVDLDGDGRLDAFSYGVPFDGSPSSELHVAYQQSDGSFAKPTLAYTTKGAIIAAGASRGDDADSDAGTYTNGDRLRLIAGDQLISLAFGAGAHEPTIESQPIAAGTPDAALFTPASKDAPAELVLLFAPNAACACGPCQTLMCIADAECDSQHCRGGQCVPCTSNDECADDELCLGRCVHAVSAQNDWTALSIASDGGCGITKKGALRCWGENDWGALPSGSFKALAVTERNSDDGYAGFGCAIRDSGELACWPGFPKALVPDPPSGRFTAIDASYSNACAIGEDGHAVCWNGSNTDVEQPPDGTYTAISIGGSHSCLVTTDGELRCVGCMGPRLDPHSDTSGNQEDMSACQHDYGQAHPPKGTFDAVAAGGEHTCAIEHGSGKLICFGHDLEGQADPPAGSYRAVAAADRDTCAIDDHGKLVCFGQSGDWLGHDVAFSALATSAWNRCALRSDGRIECQGDIGP